MASGLTLIHSRWFANHNQWFLSDFPQVTAKALVQLVEIAVFPSYLSSSKDTFKQFYLLAIETQDLASTTTTPFIHRFLYF